MSEPAEQRLSDDGVVREQRVTAERLTVRGEYQRAVVHGPIRCQFVEVVGMRGGVLAEGEVVE